LFASCELDPQRIAVWYSRTYKLRLSAFAAQTLAEHGEIDINKLDLHRTSGEDICLLIMYSISLGSREYDTHLAASDPVTGVLSPSIKALNDLGRGLAKLPTSRSGKGAKQILGAYVIGTHTSCSSTIARLIALLE
jgi:hypothetical protein